jgi:hypothetical protein
MNKNIEVDSTGAAWRASVRSNIVRKVAELRKEGTVGMSENNLWCVVTIPHHGGPGSREAARRIFSELVTECNLRATMDAAGRRIKPFIIG